MNNLAAMKEKINDSKAIVADVPLVENVYLKSRSPQVKIKCFTDPIKDFQ